MRSKFYFLPQQTLFIVAFSTLWYKAMMRWIIFAGHLLCWIYFFWDAVFFSKFVCNDTACWIVSRQSLRPWGNCCSLWLMLHIFSPHNIWHNPLLLGHLQSRASYKFLFYSWLMFFSIVYTFVLLAGVMDSLFLFLFLFAFFL